MTNNATHSIDNEKFLFFYNDLTAARWVLSINKNITDDELVSRFIEIHQIFLARLGRQEKGFLRKIPTAEMAKVVRGWALLYRSTLALLRDKHPRSPTSRDLVIGITNWSETLNISASGLLLIGHSSRYAEFWAERSIKTKDGYSSLKFRLSFIGSKTYNEYEKIVNRGELLVLDSFSNGVTSYDMMLFLRESRCSPESFVSEISRLGWRLEIGDKEAIELVCQLHAELEENILHS